MHSIRPARSTDLETIIHLYRQTIEQVNSRDYSPEQVAAWASRGSDAERWRAKLEGQHFFICESDAEMLGFASLRDDGYIDHLFVAAAAQGRGVATRLYRHLETFPLPPEVRSLSADVSLTARGFFERNGFAVVREQQVAIGDVVLTNFHMEKSLPDIRLQGSLLNSK